MKFTAEDQRDNAVEFLADYLDGEDRELAPGITEHQAITRCAEALAEALNDEADSWRENVIDQALESIRRQGYTFESELREYGTIREQAESVLAALTVEASE